MWTCRIVLDSGNKLKKNLPFFLFITLKNHFCLFALTLFAVNLNWLVIENRRINSTFSIQWWFREKESEIGCKFHRKIYIIIQTHPTGKRYRYVSFRYDVDTVIFIAGIYEIEKTFTKLCDENAFKCVSFFGTFLACHNEWYSHSERYSFFSRYIRTYIETDSHHSI